MNKNNLIYFIDTSLRDVVIDSKEICSFTKTKSKDVIWTVGLKNGQLFETREDIINLLKKIDERTSRESRRTSDAK